MPAVELESQPTAKGQPRHMRSSQAERVDERRKGIGEVGQAKRFGRIR